MRRNTSQSSLRSLGAYVSFEQLASFYLLTKQLPLKQNINALSQLAGPYKTKLRGRGIEFEDVRPYQMGDDIRTIDWRVSARSGHTYTKQFCEEKERQVFIILDQRQHMFFGSQNAMKSVLAADIAAMLAWAAFHNGDRVGGLVFNDERQESIRPKRQRNTLLSFINKIVEYNHQLKSFKPVPEYSINQVLLEIQRLAKPGTQIYFITDGFDINDESSGYLHHIARHCECVLLRPVDPLDEHLPVKGRFHVSDGEKTAFFNANNQKTQTDYHEQSRAFSHQLKGLLGQHFIPMIPVSTADEPLTVLHQYFSTSRRGK
ncbi:MAG: DUF58 domain-containing protein [Cellvibrionales bacterium]|nr:DUF58 domain-containing protein [Cellvibrionales bacterium]